MVDVDKHEILKVSYEFTNHIYVFRISKDQIANLHRKLEKKKAEVAIEQVRKMIQDRMRQCTDDIITGDVWEESVKDILGAVYKDVKEFKED